MGKLYTETCEEEDGKNCPVKQIQRILEKTFGENTNFGEIIQSTINDYRYEFNNVNNDIIKF